MRIFEYETSPFFFQKNQRKNRIVVDSIRKPDVVHRVLAGSNYLSDETNERAITFSNQYEATCISQIIDNFSCLISPLKDAFKKELQSTNLLPKPSISL